MALTDNIVSYWKLDGNSNDAVGSNNGTDTAITYSNPNGIINNGAGFNGTTSIIYKGSPTGLPSGASDASLNFWINPVTLGAALISLVEWGSLAGTGTLFSIGFNGGTLQYFGNGNDFNSGGTPSTGAWHMITATLTGTSIKIYIDAAQVGGTGTLGASPNLGSADFGMGNLFNSSSTPIATFYSGAIDEVGIWTRVLPGADITSLYNGGAGIQYPFGAGPAVSSSTAGRDFMLNNAS